MIVHTDLAEALRAEDRDEETFDLALTAGDAAVLLLIDGVWCGHEDILPDGRGH